MTDFSQYKEAALKKNTWPVETVAGLPLVFSPLLKQYPALIHAFTTRKGGNSLPPLDSFNVGMPHAADEQLRENVRLNRAKLCQSLNIPFDRLIVSGKQIHSANVVMLEAKMEPGEVDGIATKVANSPILVKCADCVPVLIYNPNQHTFCVIHAGWRGTAAGICEEAVKLLAKEKESKPENFVCAIGPSIGSCCYPVGIEVVIELAQRITASKDLQDIKNEIGKVVSKTKHGSEILKDETWHSQVHSQLEKLGLDGFFYYNGKQIHVDLKAINALQLLKLGISQLDITDFCTFCRGDLFYSFRRAHVNKEGKTGHHGAIACLTPT